MKDETGPVAGWGKDKPLIVQMFATVALGEVDGVGKLWGWIAGGKFNKRWNPPPMEDWLSLYRSHWKLFGALADAYCPAPPRRAKTSTVLRSILAMIRWCQPAHRHELAELFACVGQDEVKKQFKRAARYLGLLKKLHSKLLSDGEMTEAESKRINRLFESTEGQFFLRVFLPCFLLHGDYPQRLLFRIRHAFDNPAAMNDLMAWVRVDKSVIFEPRLSAALHRANLSAEVREAKRIYKAMTGSPPRPKPMQLRANLMALVQRMAEPFQVVSSTELKDLLDRAAQQQSGAKQKIDVELPDSPETLTKRIQRRKAMWNRIVKVYKNNSKSVHDDGKRPA